MVFVGLDILAASLYPINKEGFTASSPQNPTEDLPLFSQKLRIIQTTNDDCYATIKFYLLHGIIHLRLLFVVNFDKTRYV